MRIHSHFKSSLLKSLYLSTTIALSFSIIAMSAQVDCSGCTPAFNTVEDTISVSCEITPTPSFPSYTAGCAELEMNEVTFVATLGQSTRCEGNIAPAIGAGQDLCLTLSGFQDAGLAPSDRFFVGSESLVWTHYANGSATLTGVVYNDADVTDAYAMDVYLEGGFNWTEWTAMGNLVLDALEQGTEQDWIYFILINNMSKLNGVGANAGKTIRLQHSPLSEELGFQLGSMGANNINMNHGLGGWVNWETLEAGNTFNGVGNITIDLTNCVNSEYTCADDNDILYRFYAGNICGYDEVDILIDHTDITPPSWTYVPEDLTQECSDTPILEEATATDLCSELSISTVSDTLFGSAEGDFIVTRTFTAEDACGNATSATQTITIIDTSAPVLTIPADYTAECSENHPMEGASATDNCGIVTIDLLETTVNGACASEFTITRVFTATDDAGNSISETQTITIVDTTAPVLTIPADYTAECSDAHPMDDATATDNCGEITIDIVETTMPGTCPGEYTVTREFTATDDCGNASSATQTITIVDTTLPEFTSIPADYTAECSENHPMEDASATDNCGEVTLAVVEETVPGACAGDYIVTRTFTATDDCGNASSATQTITIIDTTSPLLTIPSDYTAECSEDHPMEDASATDNCGEVTLAVVEETVPGACVGDYIVTRLFTATDDCGNASSATQTITIIDTTSPLLTIPADYTAECSDDLPMDDASATDNCGAVSVTVIETTIAGDCDGDYSITRDFTATDDCGNATSATQTITIVDTTSPLITIPADYTAECSDDLPMEDASATDNCGAVTVTVIETTLAGDCDGDYSITRDFTATDDCGNTTSATQTITIVDTTSPLLTIPADYTAECSDAHPMDDATATDNCDVVTIAVVETTIAGDCAGDYSITRAFTATDDCGNVTSATQTITIIDTTAPSLILPENLSLSCFDSNDFGTPITSDFCSDVLLTVVSDTIFGACPAQYLITRTFVASDNCGNSATASQTIEYSDNTPPSFGSTASYLEIACSEEALLDAEAFDSCSDVLEITYIDNFGSGGCISPTSNIVRVLTAVDACGNSASLEQTIQFIDTVAPIFTYIPSDIAIDCSTDYPFDFPIITDGCSDVNLNYTLDTISMSASNDYTVHVLWTATDDCGNEKTASQLISVSDTEAPLFTQAPNLPAFLEIGTPLPTCNTMEWVASDNCYASNKITFDCTLDTVFTDNGPCIGPYEIHYLYSLSDPSGNTSEFSHVIVMTDLAPPVWISIPENATATCDEEIIWEEPVANGVNDILWEITMDTIPGVCQYTYELERTMTPVDGCGISGDTYTHSIFVSDDTSPEFVGLLTDLSLSCGEEIPLIDISAIDNCTAEVLVSDSTFISPGTCESNYIILHELTAEDLCGNTTTATYTISITDTLAPVFVNSPEDLVLELGEEFLACNDVEIEIQDNCSSAEWTCEEIIEPGLCLGASTHLRTYTASDACGNESFATQIIMILDTTAPEFTFFPSSDTLPCDGDTLPLITNSLTAYDLGSADSLTFSFESLTTGGDDCTIEKIRVYRVSDDCGNYVDSTHVTLLIDTVAPTLNTPLEDLSFTCLYDVTPCDIDQLDISDNCNTTTSSCTDFNLEGDCDNEPCTIERIYTISDLCGNSLDISQIISITASPSDSLCDPTIAIQEPTIFTSSEPACIPYPNPIRASSQGGSINLLNCPEMTEWVILNSLGKVVALGQSSTIQVTNLTQGLYFLRANGYGTQRIVVLK